MADENEKKEEKKAEKKPAAKKKAGFKRGDKVKIDATGSKGIFMEVLPNGNARVKSDRDQLEVVDMAVLEKLNG